MEKREYLLDRLKEYGKSDFYPFHMPGHKRQAGESFAAGFPNPFSVDITEIDGFDNLHRPEGILKESMEWTAGIYGADRTYYLVNGSSSGVLSAICGATKSGGKLLMGRGCHKSAYHGVILNRLETVYLYPQVIDGFGIQGGYLAEEIEECLQKEPDIQAVLVVSPTYEGVVSDVEAIARIVHGRGLPLIVDEAHGAHFPFGKEAGAPLSALEAGADVVIQSLHKTLPALTQTAVMHMNGGIVDLERIERYVHVFQSSSPSYVLLAGIENCIRWMDGEGRKRMADFYRTLKEFRKELGQMKHLKLLPETVSGKGGVFALDETKIVVSCRNTGITGPALFRRLRDRFHLELEMCGPDYVTAITTVADTKEGFERLLDALTEIDETLGTEPDLGVDNREAPKAGAHGVMPMAEALDFPCRAVPWEESSGEISAELVYIYPPGIPITAPGEILTEEIVERILDYKKKGLPVQGMQDESGQTVKIVARQG